LKILILGSSGFLGKSLLYELKKKNYSIFEAFREDFVLKDGIIKISESLKTKINQSNICINCIANTNFMECEKEGPESIANILIPEALSYYINEKTKLIHISSDIFYENSSNNSDELTKLTLNNEYSIQKEISENFFNEKNSLILRTSFLGYNHRKTGILNHIYNSLENNIIISGWSDVISSSVSIHHLASLIKKIIEQRITINGVYNFGTLEPFSKYDYILSTLKLFKREDLVIKTNYVNDLYKRNINSGMSSKKIKEELGISLPLFEDVVLESFHDINQLYNR